MLLVFDYIKFVMVPSIDCSLFHFSFLGRLSHRKLEVIENWNLWYVLRTPSCKVLLRGMREMNAFFFQYVSLLNNIKILQQFACSLVLYKFTTILSLILTTKSYTSKETWVYKSHQMKSDYSWCIKPYQLSGIVKSKLFVNGIANCFSHDTIGLHIIP